MKHFFALFFQFTLVTLPCIAYSQSLPSKPTMFSHEIAQALLDGKMGKSTAASHYSYIGKTRKALETYELERLDWGLDSMNNEDSLYFLQFRPVDAYEYLSKRLETEHLVIISEAHPNPIHRVFTRRLLQSLWQDGYRHLGLETITPNFEDTTCFLMDTLLHKRGYPLNSQVSGIYTQEPQMANLVRDAIELGFQVFAYEKTIQETERDWQQALNIKRYMDLHPGEKLVVHCGWYHAVESNFPKGGNANYMAYHLKRMTGIDPFTIYQDALTEKLKQPESPFYRLVNADKTSVLLDENGHLFNGVDTMPHFDALIFHPKTKYVINRPDWLANMPGHFIVKVDKEKLPNGNYPVIIQAFRATDGDGATPIDMIELETPEDETPLVLKNGNYSIRIIGMDRTISEYQQLVNNK